MVDESSSSEACTLGIRSMFFLSTQGMFGVSWYPHFFYFNLFEPKILAQDEGDEDDGRLDISVAGPTFRLQDDVS